jgi:crossover junction endodeoxyribonuclease RuvC
MPTGKEKIIIGIDPGIADTGYGVIIADQGKLQHITHGSIKTAADLPLNERLLKLNQDLSEIIKKYQPEIAVVEQLFFCNNAKTAFSVGQARGVILLTLTKAKLKFLELTPLQVKQGLTGYGNADKKQIQQMVKVILNLKEIPKPDDAADALAMAICGSSMYKLCFLK